MSEKWHVQKEEFWSYIVDQSGNYIVAAAVHNPACGEKELNLIAAASEMLALLKTSRRNLSSIIAACNCNTYDPWLGEMDRVIALAEGGDA